MRELYISTDIESDGQIPGRFSMLSLASAVFTIDKELLGTFSVNLLPLEGAAQDPATMEFWADNPEAWAECNREQRDPAEAMQDYLDWLKNICGEDRPVFMAYPGTFDFMWTHWYLINFTGEDPMGFAGLCMKSFGMAQKKVEFRRSIKSRYPRRWFDDLPHTHVALDDAVEQGAMGINMIRENRKLPKISKIQMLPSA